MSQEKTLYPMRPRFSIEAIIGGNRDSKTKPQTSSHIRGGTTISGRRRDSLWKTMPASWVPVWEYMIIHENINHINIIR
ncbi:hypothetical protein E2C01_027224 [Portunus trituberculatus]|uniref:Uncharacterized protein n=1 Tax=Portunus trituberculatus TaxID=210409 RepID=A0A5B7EKS1_PORTR|nr:hypothetical protein [Portunus trituberculatus]